MNRQSIINKFIDVCGSPIAGKDGLFIYGSIFGHIGLTTKLKESIHAITEKYLKDWNHLPTTELRQVSAGAVLPRIHIERTGYYFDFDRIDLLNCMRFLENKPFQKITVTYWPEEPLPMFMSRKDVDIHVILAPHMGNIPIANLIETKSEKFRGNPWSSGKPDLNWIRQLDQTTFWLVQFPTVKGSYYAGMYGYPVGETIICKSCSIEIDKQTWINNKLLRNHPECMCSCNTYDDFCGCARKRNSIANEQMWQQLNRARRIKNRKTEWS